MMKRFLTAAAVMLALFSTTNVQAAIVLDPGFEAPVISANSFALASVGTQNPNIPTSPWTYTGRAGIVSGNGGGFGVTGQDMAQAAVLQSLNGAAASFTQTITLAAGSYTLSFIDENRSNSGQASFTVTLGGSTIGGDSPGTGSFTPFTNIFQTVGGTLALTFTATAGSSADTTSFIDDVQITANAVPEPASIAMMGLGLIASAGFAARKARRNRN